MARAWPFEDVPEGGRQLRAPDDFVRARSEGTEAVIVRIGGHDAQLVLVDRAGSWQRWVYPSVEDATRVAEDLGIPLHVGSFPEEMRVRINAFVRPRADYDRSAYPEQGRVGPVSAFKENRARRRSVQLRKQQPEGTE